MARFPAIEPEPPPVSFVRRLARVTAVLAAVAGVGAAVTVAPTLGDDAVPRPEPTGAPAAPGRVVVVDGMHLSITDSRGAVRGPLTDDLQIDPAFVDVVPDPAGKRAVTGAGPGFGETTQLLVDLTRPMARAVPAVPADLLQDGVLAAAPWADRGRSLVLASGPELDRLGLVDVTTGRVTPVGRGTSAAGDPTAAAVLAATGGRALPDVDGRHAGGTFARIERLQAGRRPVLLRTAQQLAADAGLPATEPLLVQRLVVSPDGGRIVLGLDAAGTREFPRGTNNPPRVRPAGALVVLDRAGRVVAVRRSLDGHGLDWVRWSHDGRLALGVSVETDTVNSADHVLTYWDLRAPPLEVRLPGAFPNTLLTPCTWSPTGERLLCGDDRGWFDVEPRTNRVEVRRPVTGRPVVWLP
jgi:hypothetical protein